MMPTPDEYCIRAVDLPYTVRGMIVFDENDFANIYINSRLSREEQQLALRHELRHLRMNDAYNDTDIRIAEP